MMPHLKDAELVGSDTFKNDDASIAVADQPHQGLPKEPDAIMLCTMMPGAVSAIKQIRAAGIKSMILNGSGMDGSYWLSPFPTCRTSTCRYRARSMATTRIRRSTSSTRSTRTVTGGDPSSQYVYPGYVLIDVWAKAVERAKTTDAEAVVAELEKMNNEATLFGPRTFSKDLHHQNQGRYLIVDTEKASRRWSISGRFRRRSRSTIWCPSRLASRRHRLRASGGLASLGRSP